MELYAQYVCTVPTDVDGLAIPRESAFVAAEMLFASLLALNATDSRRDVNSLWELAVQVTNRNATGAVTSQTPYAHISTALDQIIRSVALADGWNGEQADEIVSMARDTIYDLIGESDPVRRAYDFAAADVRADAEALAFRMSDACPHNVKCWSARECADASAGLVTFD